MWYKCIKGKVFYSDFTVGEWYKCIGDLSKSFAFIDNKGDENGWAPRNHIYFDLDNPRSFDPSKRKLFNKH
jgi:hypothetical protein